MKKPPRGLLSIVALVVLAACAGARREGPSSPAPQTVTVTPPRAGDVEAADAATPRVERSLGELAALVYEAVNDARWADARALLDDYDDDMSCSDGSVHAQPIDGGGETLVGARGLARTDAAGKIVSHEVFAEGCVRHAGPALTVLMRKDSVLVRTKDASHVLAHASTEETSVFDASVSISDAWVLALDRGEDWLAVRRRDGKAIRGHHRVALFGSEHPGVTAGPFFLIRRDKELMLTNEDGKIAPVKGCPGYLRDAVARPGGLVIHVAKELDGMPAADTQLCFVRPDGITRRIVQLGHATCGLAGPVPCDWGLLAATSRLFAFGSFRGHQKVVDAVTGKELALPSGMPPEGSTSVGFSECKDDICLSYEMADGARFSSTVRLTGGIVSFGPPTAEIEPRWCAREGLPVPREVCDLVSRP